MLGFVMERFRNCRVLFVCLIDCLYNANIIPRKYKLIFLFQFIVD